MKKILIILAILLPIWGVSQTIIEPFVTADKVQLDSLYTDSVYGSFWLDGTELKIYNGTAWGTVGSGGGGGTTVDSTFIADNIGWISDTANNYTYTSPEHNVGIGTATPAYELDVNGATRIVGDLYPSEWVNVKLYGATGDGVTDDATNIQSAITAAQTAEKPLYFPKGNYLVSTTLTVTDTLEIFGEGMNSILSTAMNDEILGVHSDNFRISGVKFVGDGDGSGKTLQMGIWLNSTKDYWIESCEFYTLGGNAIYATGSTSLNRGGEIIGCSVLDCTNGIVIGAAFEYVSVNGNKIENCSGVAISSGGGNNSIKNNQIKFNGTGILYNTGYNDGHSIIIGNTINHNTVNIDLNDLVNGMMVVGNTIFAGDISLDSTRGVEFASNTLGTVDVYFDGSMGTVWTNNTYGASVTFTNDYNGNTSYTLMSGNVPLADTLSFPYTFVATSDSDTSVIFTNKSGVIKTVIKDDGSFTTLGSVSRGGTMYGTNASTHVNLGDVTSITGYTGQNYSYNTVGGGIGNQANLSYSTVGGGSLNKAIGEYCFVGGGSGNQQSGTSSVTVGGLNNRGDGTYTTISGGGANYTDGTGGTVGGGVSNIVYGDYSWAMGQNMQLSATADHSFVFGHHTSAVAITEPNVALFFPSGTAGKVGIGTTTPSSALDVIGKITVSASTHLFAYFGDSAVTFTYAAQDTWYQVTNATDSLFRYAETDGFTIDGDTMTFTGTADFDLEAQLTLDGATGETVFMRFYNVTQAAVIPTTSAQTLSGTGAYRTIHVSSYAHITAGDEVILQVSNDDATPANSTLKSGVIKAYYVHD